jgi:predicted kinase
MNSLILLRGLPGSGKTTMANVLSEEGKYPVFSVDDYFTQPETGDYQFKFDENYLAYQLCENNTRLAMEREEKKIILHNTFTLEWELKPYFEMASKFSYRVFVMTMENRHSGENVHGVSKEQLEKMAASYRVVLF